MNNIFNWSKNTQGRFVSTAFNVSDLPPKKFIEYMNKLYDNNDLYRDEEWSSYWSSEWMEAMKPLRTCVHRSVEFYVSRVAQGEPIITSDNEAILEPIQQFLRDSNFISLKPRSLRSLALYGDLFEKVEFDGTKVYKTLLDLKTVTLFLEDARGFLTEIRIDIPLPKEDGVAKYYTEYWTLENGGYVATWTHNRDEETPLEQLGEPDSYMALAQLGIDFIPIKHTKFVDTGKDRGSGCTIHALKKIEEANRKATRLSQILFRFNKPLFGVTTGRDEENRPLPVPKVRTSPTTSTTDKGNTEDGTFLYIPGAEVTDLIPRINYADALAILKADESELEKDLPELRYYSLSASDISGVAIRSLLAAAIDRANEAQTNYVESQRRLIQMALTIGKMNGVYPRTIGNYEAGDFEFDMAFSSIFQVSDQDRANLFKTYMDTGLNLVTSMRLAGYSADEIEQAVSENPETNLATTLSSFNRQ